MNEDSGRTVNFKAVLERDSKRCLYCGAEADCVDHIIPWSYNKNNRMSNLASSCTPCNLTASDHLFDNFADKAFYILTRRRLLVGFETSEGQFISADIPTPAMEIEEPVTNIKKRERYYCEICDRKCLDKTALTRHKESAEHGRLVRITESAKILL